MGIFIFEFKFDIDILWFRLYYWNFYLFVYLYIKYLLNICIVLDLLLGFRVEIRRVYNFKEFLI